VLFNSFHFILGFLPVVILLTWFATSRIGRTTAIGSLILASLFFYGWWNPSFLALLVASVSGNYALGVVLRTLARQKRHLVARIVLITGISANLGTIGYFKYAGFLTEIISSLIAIDWTLGAIVLPLGISFFTFQQIAYIVDCAHENVDSHGFFDYALFVTFFPQLIAGPIVYHRDILPQIRSGEAAFMFRTSDLGIGAKIFAFGLIKKVVLADGMAVYATPVFEAADAGATLTFIEAWGGALAYTLQLYFDFSGYSDMAIGLGRMFGLRLPINFRAPYKATSIIDFWRRWHITLSMFLRNYLYIPLGGNRHGKSRRWINLMITMLLGGLWHGAGWTFVVWGGLHGAYLCLNHLWRHVARRAGINLKASAAGRVVSWGVTFLAVVIAWVFFRAETFHGAIGVLYGMAGLNGIILPEAWAGRLASLPAALTVFGLGPTPYFTGAVQVLMTGLILMIALFAPTTQQWVRWQFDGGSTVGRWRLGTVVATGFGLIGGYTMIRLFVGGYSEFLYFQF
tara:strand:+ start:828 stop:2366 length:1539 start_codon:yes stop_codon:yes gene_type:complete